MPLDEATDRDRALVIVIVGAESTGKSTLAEALAARIGQSTGLKTTWVPEVLRAWCYDAGRTPRCDEQAAILAEQARRIDAAATVHEVVVSDTAPLQTAVYSRYIFGDHSLDDEALRWHRRVDLSLLTALDVPWVADTPRDGPHVRLPVDDLLRELLLRDGGRWAVVSGLGAARTEAALAAVLPLLRSRARPGSGLFSRLTGGQAAEPAAVWVCADCDVPACEQATHRRSLQRR